MEKEKKEQLIHEIIGFFKKWALWCPCQIYCDGICYSSYRLKGPCEEGIGDLSQVYIGPSTFNTAGTLMECEEETPPYEPFMILYFEGAEFSELIHYRFYMAPTQEIAKDALMFIAKEEGILEDIKEDLHCSPILNETEFESYDDYWELESELEEQEIQDRLWDLYKIDCGCEVICAIRKELDNIFCQVRR